MHGVDSEESSIVVSDADVLIHFMSVDRLDLLRDSSCRFLVTTHVRHEVTCRSDHDRVLFDLGSCL